MGELVDTSEDLAQLARLAINEQTEDVRLFVARLVRKYRGIKPDLAEQMDQYLRSKPTRSGGVMRKSSRKEEPSNPVPVDNESRILIFPYNAQSIGTNFERMCKLLGIVDLHFHDLRHAATSRLFRLGYSIEQVQQFTLHDDWKTLARYTHLKPEDID